MNLQGLCTPVVVMSIYEVEFTTASDKKKVVLVMTTTTTTTVIMMVVVVVVQMIASKVDLMCSGLQTIVYHILFSMFLKAKVRQH
jgi:hypothetical protein